MTCSKCKETVYRAFSYSDSQGNWHSGECSDCYPLGKVMTYSAADKVRTRVLAPDGQTVLQGREGTSLRRRMYGKA